jgi:hypothetical protein
METWKTNIINVILWCFGLKKTFAAKLTKAVELKSFFYRKNGTVMVTGKGRDLINNANRAQVLRDSLRSNKHSPEAREEISGELTRLNRESKLIAERPNIIDPKIEADIEESNEFIKRKHTYIKTEASKFNDALTNSRITSPDVPINNETTVDYGVGDTYQWNQTQKAEELLANSVSVKELLSETPIELDDRNSYRIANGYDAILNQKVRVISRGDNVEISFGKIIREAHDVTMKPVWKIELESGEKVTSSDGRDVFPVDPYGNVVESVNQV